MTIGEAARVQRRVWALTMLGWALPSMMIAGAVAVHSASPVNHDVAWILEGADRLLAGGRFGIDVIDVNPPLAWWIALVPAALTAATGLPMAFAASAFVGALGAVSLAASLWLLPVESSGRLRRIGFALAGAYLLLVMPGYDFGQREHLMAILGLPYILLRGSNRRISAVAAVAIGLAAGLGFCLKPYFLLAPIGLEGWRWARTRHLSGCIAPETIAVGVFGLAYAAAIVLLAPAYLHNVLPASVAGYWAYNNPFIPVARTVVARAAPGTLALLVVMATARRGAGTPSQAQALVVAGVMAMAGALIQLKGWDYHLLPITIDFSFGACIACLAPARARSGRLLRALGLAVPLIGAFPYPLAVLRHPGIDETTTSVVGLANAFRQDAGPGGTVFALITSPRDVHPAVLAAGVHWAAPFCCLYLLPALVGADQAAPEKRAAAEAAGRDQLRAALAVVTVEKPSVIAVDEATYKLGFADRPFDYLRWLGRYPGWAEALSAYRDGGTVGRFQLLIRK